MMQSSTATYIVWSFPK